MLNGIYPVLLFYTAPTDESGKNFLPPIPVYLDEGMTKLALNGESESLEIASESLADLKEGELNVVQKGVSQSVRLEFEAREDDPILGLLLSMLKTLAVDVLNKKEYKVAYFHRNILIFNAKLTGYEKNPESGTNKIALSINLEIKPEKAKKQEAEEPKPTLQYSSSNPDLVSTVKTEGIASDFDKLKNNFVPMTYTDPNTGTLWTEKITEQGDKIDVIISTPKVVIRRNLL